ncbi:flavin reductase family protein [Microbacterium album]|uniref:Flavin reductase like domain-containing protein n=1 Tax=Microbacterium album TaxID=2053191 RepID=A0A917MLK8_9MICO|nr:flavin reductase family protein [Microbacterium album]GGH43009.1 hypothetical protein GCM10010921_16610 [Microbacterium album]GGH48599.1 hypothetical protein GCM10010921_26190 [Microbacterium album]
MSNTSANTEPDDSSASGREERDAASRDHAGELLSVPGSLDADGFKTLFRGHPGGVSVITAEGPDGPVALTATSVASVSVDPPMLIFSVSALSSATPAILAADTIVVHLLDADDLPLARLASTSGVDRFADTSQWTRLSTGEPLFPGARAWARCAIVSRLEAGGSTVIAAHALQGETNRGPEHEAGALVYHNRTWHRLGDASRIG